MDNLLQFLGEQRPEIGRFHNWQFQRIGGSANNLLYHATDNTADLAIKFTIRDARHRARREYQALLALQQADVVLAPQPVLLDESSYPLPVVVQSWLAGEVTAEPPQTSAAWQQLIEHYASIAQVTAEQVTVPLAMAVINFTTIAHAHQHIQQQLAAIPLSEHPPSKNCSRASLPLRPPAHLLPLSPSAAMTATASTSSAILANGSR